MLSLLCNTTLRETYLVPMFTYFMCQPMAVIFSQACNLQCSFALLCLFLALLLSAYYICIGCHKMPWKLCIEGLYRNVLKQKRCNVLMNIILHLCNALFWVVYIMIIWRMFLLRICNEAY